MRLIITDMVGYVRSICRLMMMMPCDITLAGEVIYYKAPYPARYMPRRRAYAFH